MAGANLNLKLWPIDWRDEFDGLKYGTEKDLQDALIKRMEGFYTGPAVAEVSDTIRIINVDRAKWNRLKKKLMNLYWFITSVQDFEVTKTIIVKMISRVHDVCAMPPVSLICGRCLRDAFKAKNPEAKFHMFYFRSSKFRSTDKVVLCTESYISSESRKRAGRWPFIICESGFTPSGSILKQKALLWLHKLPRGGWGGPFGGGAKGCLTIEMLRRRGRLNRIDVVYYYWNGGHIDDSRRVTISRYMSEDVVLRLPYSGFCDRLSEIGDPVEKDLIISHVYLRRFFEAVAVQNKVFNEERERRMDNERSEQRVWAEASRRRQKK